VRFAPSPTGYLHIGGARTALFNWLWARKHKGVFVLRVEDTDRERSTEESVRAVLESMRWLGLDWDEGPEVGGPHGPYFQTERLPIYREHAERLIALGKAYRCFCTKEVLAQAREAHKQTGSRDAFRYPGTCRDRVDEPDRPHVVRMKMPSAGTTGWLDLVRDRIDVPNSAQQDVILLRSDGVPLYNFGAVVDDVTMGVTLVARGDDHIVNTPIQILLYEAFGYPVPKMVHLPMILAPNGEKLSKRHAAVSVLDYRTQGYVPDAILNYLARLGWSHGDQEIFSRTELIEKFDWEHVGKTASKYDGKKFLYVQGEHLRALPDAEIARFAVPFLAENKIRVEADDPRLLSAIPLIRPRVHTFVDVANMVDYFLRDEPVMHEAARQTFLTAENLALLGELADVLEKVNPFDRAPLEAAMKTWLTERNVPMKQVAQAARVALTGRTESPGLFEVMEVLGPERALARMRGHALHQ